MMDSGVQMLKPSIAALAVSRSVVRDMFGIRALELTIHDFAPSIGETSSSANLPPFQQRQGQKASNSISGICSF